MTVSSEVKRKDYAGNGSTANFATVFRFLQNSDIKVILTVDATAIETVQTEITNYTLSGSGLDAGGTVTMIVAPPTGTTLTVKRDVPLTQGTDYIENDDFPADSHEDALDKLTMITQQMQEELDRSLKFTEAEATASALLPALEALKFMRVKSDLSGFELTAGTTSASAVDVLNTPAGNISAINVQDALNELDAEKAKITLNTVAVMVSNTSLQVGDIVETAGYTAKGDGGQNQYEIVAAATGTDDDGSFIDLAALQAKGLFPGGVVRSKQFGATHNGTTDDRLALFNADAFGPVSLNSGAALVSSELTFTNAVTFESGAIIKPSASITVTFNADPIAGDMRIFDMSNSSSAIANLKKVNMLWFAGHLLNTTTDATAVIQSAYDACVVSGEVVWPVGFLTKTGATVTNVSKGQKTRGAGPFTSEMRFSTSSNNGLSLTTTISPSIKGMSFLSTVRPSSGTTIKTAIAFTEYDNVIVRNGWEGMAFESGSSSSTVKNYHVLDCLSIGVRVQETNDVFFDQFTISAPLDFFDLSGVSGTFVADEVITGGTSGATGTVKEIVSATIIKVLVGDINFTATETITGGTSAATATLDAQVIHHALGGIRLFNKAEAIIFSDGDVIGGNFAITTDAAVNSLGVRPAYNRFTNVYFDSADNGASFDKAVDFEFSGCWFSNRPNHGCVLNAGCDTFSFNGTSFINSWLNGLLIQPGAVNTIVDGCKISGNNVSGGANSGVNVSTAVTDFVITNSRIGGTLGFGTQNIGVNINTGASDRYIVADNLVSGNTSAGVVDNGTGVNKRVADNY